jgi:hypothetical protein
MSLIDAAGQVIGQVAGKLLRRLTGWLLVGIFALAAVYELTVAIVLALEAKFGVVTAHLLVGAFYILAALGAFGYLWMTSRRTSSATAPKVGSLHPQIELQLSTIVEAMLLGYSLSRRK